MSGQQDLAWETQDGVRSLQAALNSQPPVPMPLASWDTNTNSIPKLEGLDTIDLSTAPLMRSSPPVARPTILPQRSLVVTHPYSTPMGEVHQSHNPPQYVNLDGELLSQSPHSGKRVRVKSREKSGETGEGRPCRVCGERAGKHSYYGGQVCPSCRAFFRRSVQSGYNATYFCVKDGSCQVTLKTRKNCQFCRYKLCEAAGMRTTWVLSEEELVAIGGYVKASDYWDQSNDLDTSLLRQIIRMVAFGARITMDGQEQLLAVMTERTIGFVTSIPEFQQLCRTDREELLRNNLNIVMRKETLMRN